MKISTQKGSAQTRQMAVLTIVPPRSAYQPLSGDAAGICVSVARLIPL